MKEKIVPDWILKQMETKDFPFYQDAIIAGSRGGYVVIASEKEIDGAIKIRIGY